MEKFDGYLANFKIPIDGGSGGTVFKAKHEETDELAAVKRILLPEKDVEGQEYLDTQKEIATEMKLIRSLKNKHPNIINVITTDQTTIEEDGKRTFFYIVTEYCPFGNLGKYFKSHLLHYQQHLTTMEEVASALAFLHGHNPAIIHRDVKPGNILVKLDGNKHVVRLCDLGISRALEGDKSKETWTILGTKEYRAPELFKIEASKDGKKKTQYDCSGAADKFAAALVFYQILKSKPGEGMADLQDLDSHRPSASSHKKELSIGETMTEDSGLEFLELLPIEPEFMAKLTDIIKPMLHFEPSQRTSMSDVESSIRALRYSLPIHLGLPPLSRPERPEMAVKGRQYDLGFRAYDYNIGFSDHGILLENSEIQDCNMVKLRLTYDSGIVTYRTRWTASRPGDIKAKSRKYVITGDLTVMRYNDKNPTIVCDSELNVTHVFHGDYGVLCGVIHGNKLMYWKKTGDRCQVDVYDSCVHNKLATLTCTFSFVNLSSSSHPSGWFVITDHNGNTLDVFSPDYQHHRRVQLAYTPWGHNAVACVKDYVVVVEYRGGLVVHSCSGDEVCRLTRGELGVDRDILGVGGGGEGRLQLAVGSAYNQKVESLHVYHVK